MTSAYTRSGVDTGLADEATDGLAQVLATIALGRSKRARLGLGHYAEVLEITHGLGIALSMDGVGSKAVVAEVLGDFRTVGIDCVAMNVNDVICVGAEPIALLDYISVQRADPAMIRDIAIGLKSGAERAGVEIPGGEIAQLPDMVKGAHDRGFDLVGACIGRVRLDQVVTGSSIQPGDQIVGLPSSGLHANGLTLARNVFRDWNEKPKALGGKSVAEILIAPTEIYVGAIMNLLRSGIEVHGLAHITSTSFRNLLRLNEDVGYRIDSLSELPRQAIFDLVQERRPDIDAAEMYEVFNMGCGFCCIVRDEDLEATLEILRTDHPGAAVIGVVTEDRGEVHLPPAGIVGTHHEQFRPI